MSNHPDNYDSPPDRIVFNPTPFTPPAIEDWWREKFIEEIKKPTLWAEWEEFDDGPMAAIEEYEAALAEVDSEAT